MRFFSPLLAFIFFAGPAISEMTCVATVEGVATELKVVGVRTWANPSPGALSHPVNTSTTVNPKIVNYGQGASDQHFVDSFEIAQTVDVPQGAELTLVYGQQAEGASNDRVDFGHIPGDAGSPSSFAGATGSAAVLGANTSQLFVIPPALLQQSLANPYGPRGALLDVHVSDDTRVLSGNLEYCVKSNSLTLRPLSCRLPQHTIKDGPWGVMTVDVYPQGMPVLFDMITVNADSYHVTVKRLDESNPIPSVGFPVLATLGTPGWKCANCQPPSWIDARAEAGGTLAPGFYSLGVAIGPIWKAETVYFRIQ